MSDTDFVIDLDLVPDEFKSDKKRKIGVLESTRMKAQQASGETYADTAWDTTRAVGESVLPFSGKIRNIRSNMETKGSQELIQSETPDIRESGSGFKIDPSRKFSSVRGERSEFDTEIDNLAARAGIDSEGMKYAEELSGGDPRKKLEILQSFAKAGLANKTANKEDAGSELSVTRQSVLGKIGSGAIDNSGYSLEYAVGSAVGLPGVLAGVAGASERFNNLTTPDYEIDPETGEAVSRNNQDSGSEAALKAGVGAAMEVGLEIGTEAILGAVGRGLSWGIGKAVGKSGKAVRQAGKDAARQYSRGTAKQLEKSVVGRTILRSGKAYDELTKITGINSLPVEWVEEVFQDPADSLTGVGSKSADFDFKTELREYMDRASSMEYHTDIILGMLGTTAIQGAGAAIRQYQRDSKQSRNDDGFLKAYGLSDESIGTLNPRDKQFLRRVFSNPSMTPEKAQRALRSFGEKANMAAKAIIDNEGYDFEANQAGIKSDFVLPDKVPEVGEIYTDAQSGISVLNQDDGGVRLFNRDGSDAGVFESAVEALEAADTLSKRNQMTDMRRSQKETFIRNTAERIAGGIDIEIHNTVSDFVAANPEIVKDPDFDIKSTGTTLAGKVHLILDNINAPQEAISTIMHEAGVHEGLKRVLSTEAERSAFLNNLNSEEVQGFSGWLQKLGYVPSSLSEEALAYMYENRYANPSGYQKAVKWINDKLRKINPEYGFSESDIEVIMADAQRSVQGDSGTVTRDAEVAGDSGDVAQRTQRTQRSEALRQSALQTEEEGVTIQAPEYNEEEIAPYSPEISSPESITQAQQQNTQQQNTEQQAQNNINPPQTSPVEESLTPPTAADVEAAGEPLSNELAARTVVRVDLSKTGANWKDATALFEDALNAPDRATFGRRKRELYEKGVSQMGMGMLEEAWLDRHPDVRASEAEQREAERAATTPRSRAEGRIAERLPVSAALLRELGLTPPPGYTLDADGGLWRYTESDSSKLTPTPEANEVTPPTEADVEAAKPVKPEKKDRKPKQKGRGKGPGAWIQKDENSDILRLTNFIYENGRLISQKKGKKGRLSGEFDNAGGGVKRWGPFYRFIYGGSESPDQVAHAAWEAGILKSPDPSLLFDVLDSEIEAFRKKKASLLNDGVYLDKEQEALAAHQKLVENGDIFDNGQLVKLLSGDIVEVEDSFIDTQSERLMYVVKDRYGYSSYIPSMEVVSSESQWDDPTEMEGYWKQREAEENERASIESGGIEKEQSRDVADGSLSDRSGRNEQVSEKEKPRGRNDGSLFDESEIGFNLAQDTVADPEKATKAREEEKAKAAEAQRQKDSAPVLPGVEIAKTKTKIDQILDNVGVAAAEYGWRVEDGKLFNRSGKEVHSVKVQQGRIKLFDTNGKLRGTLPISKPGNIGKYLEDTFYAKKLEAEIPEGWKESEPGGSITNRDPENGGIIEKQISSGKWFFIANNVSIPQQDGFATREEAYKAFVEAVKKDANSEEYVYESPLRPLWIGFSSAIGQPYKALGERTFSTKEPLSKEKLDSLELKLIPSVKQKEKQEAEVEKPAEAPQPAKPAAESQAPKVFPQALAQQMLSLPVERRAAPFGPSYKDLRRAIIKATTGKSVPSSKAGMTAVRNAMIEFFGIDPKSTTIAGVDKQIVEKLREAAGYGVEQEQEAEQDSILPKEQLDDIQPSDYVYYDTAGQPDLQATVIRVYPNDVYVDTGFGNQMVEKAIIKKTRMGEIRKARIESDQRSAKFVKPDADVAAPENESGNKDKIVYKNGDKVRLTGDVVTLNGGEFDVGIWLEGSNKGKEAFIPTDRQKEKNAAEKKAAFTKQQEEFSRLNQKPAKPKVEVKSPVANLSAEDQKRAKELQDRLRALRGRSSMGVDPEFLNIGVELTGLYIKGGIKTFKQYAQAMKQDLGDIWEKLKNELRTLWEGAANEYPDIEEVTRKQAADIIADVDKESQTSDNIIESEENNVLNPSDSNEQGGQDAEAQDMAGQGDLFSGERGRGGMASGGSQTGSSSQGGAVEGDSNVSDGAASPDGARGDQQVRDEESAVPERPAGDSEQAGGTGFDEAGLSDDLFDRAEDVDESSAGEEGADQRSVATGDPQARRKAQKRADQVKVVRGDSDNIEKTLPLLFKSQHKDVKFAEDRFAKPDGHGVLFTNGTGAGKTYSGMGVIKRFVREGRSNILVVAPSQGVIDAWLAAAEDLGVPVRQLKDTNDNGRQGVVVTTYANMGMNMTLADREWDLVVADESQNFLQKQDSTELTKSGQALRAITKHLRGTNHRSKMLYRKLHEERDELNDKWKNARKNGLQALAEKLDAQYNALNKKIRDLETKLFEDVEASQKNRTKVVFLSATPFAYVENIEYAEGYLFSYGKEPSEGGRNEPSAQQRYLMQNFGYVMRYNRLEKPPASVNSDVMERNWNEQMVKSRVMSGRRIDIPSDYQRKFALTPDKVGKTIDDALSFLARADNGKFFRLYEFVNKKFAYQQRMYLLEAIKAKNAVPIIYRWMKDGKKVVVFHDYNQGGGFKPFDFEGIGKKIIVRDRQGKMQTVKSADLIEDFFSRNPEVEKMDFSDLRSPIETIKTNFPGALIYNGTVSPKERGSIMKLFNDDNSGKNLIVVQAQSGGTGISLHDRTGKFPRMTLNLGLPARPVMSIQQEGRTYRVGQHPDSNAFFLYMNTGTSWEANAFAQKMFERGATVENLAMGFQARRLRQSYIEGFADSDIYFPSQSDGIGGKANDINEDIISEYEMSKTYYFARQKKTAKNKAREGKDYFATPEPLGFKMVQFAELKEGQSILEPSSGHGAISRFFPDNHKNTIIEPSQELFSQAHLSGNADTRAINGSFEDHDIHNKYDAVTMNPPFGTGGKTAMEHIDKAFNQHLRDGGRVVAIIPNGGMMDKRFNQWYEAQDNAVLRASITLPPVTFNRAGTSVGTRMIVLDRYENKVDREIAISESIGEIDLGGISDINELFDRMENMEVPDRIAVAAPAPSVKSAAAALFSGRDGVLPNMVQPGGKPVITKVRHTRKDVDIFILKMQKRVERDEYKQLESEVKAQDGWYSRQFGSSPAGFAFMSEAGAQEFAAKYPDVFIKPDKAMFRRSLTEADRDYMAAVERGDTDAAQRMVDEAAREAGYNVGPVWHGTTEEFSEFIIEPDGMPLDQAAFFVMNRKIAEDFAGSKGGDRVVRAFVKILNGANVGRVEDAVTIDQLWERVGAPLDTIPDSEKNNQGDFEQPVWRYYAENEQIIQTLKSLGHDGLVGSEQGAEMFAVFSPSQIKLADPVTYDDEGNVIPLSERFDQKRDDIRFRRVIDKKLIKELEEGKKTKAYAAMQLVDGKLFSPMAAKVDGKWTVPAEIGEWYQTDERPDLAYEKKRKQPGSFYFKLDKGNKTQVEARYNPYFHSSLSPLNDQFTSASNRANLVTVEVELSSSDIESGYKADKAKDAVGEHTWKAGPVARLLPSGKERKVFLSQYRKITRIIPDSEVAKKIADIIKGENITIPENVVTPSLYEELKKIGAPVAPKAMFRRSLFNPPIEKDYDGNPVVGMTKAYVNIERERLGFSKIDRPAIVHNIAAIEAGLDLLHDSPQAGERLVASIMKAPRALSTKEHGLMAVFHLTLAERLETVQDNIQKAESQNNLDDLESLRYAEEVVLGKLEEWGKARRASGSESGRSLQAMKMRLALDYSLASMVRKAMDDNGGKKLPAPRYEEIVEQYNRLKKAYEELQAGIRKEEDKKHRSNIGTEIKRMKREGKRMTAEQHQETLDAIEEAADMNNGEWFGIDNFRDMIKRMVRYHVGEGLDSVNDVFDAVHEDIAHMFNGITRRDIMDIYSRYGETFQLSQEDIAVRMRQIRAEAQKMSAIADMLNQEAPLITGLIPDDPSQLTRELTRELNQMLKDSGLRSKSKAQRKTPLDIFEHRLRNDIIDMTKAIESGKKINRNTGQIVLDEKAQQLKAARDEVKKVYDAIFKTELTPEQRLEAAIKAAERSLLNAEERLERAKIGDFDEDTKNIEPDARLAEIRRKRDLINEEVARLKDEAMPEIREAKLIRARERQLQKSLDNYTRRMLNGDYAPLPKKQQVVSPEIFRLSQEVEKIKKEFEKGRREWKLKQEGFKGTLKKYGKHVDDSIRAFKTAYDASAVGVQNAALIAAHPILGAKAAATMAKAGLSDYEAHKIHQELKSHPDFADAVMNGLDILDYESDKIGERPEEFRRDSLAEVIPGVKASERMYSTYMNVLHLAVYSALKNSGIYGAAGPSKADKQGIANYVNVLGGRGNLGQHQQAANTLSHFIWSTRLMVSRFQMLMLQPVWGPNQTSGKHKAFIASQMARSFAGMAAITVLMNMLFGDDDEDVQRMQKDINSKLFGKVRIGNTTVDLTGGLTGYMTFISNIISGARTTMTGRKVDTTTAFGDSPYTQVARFARGKLAPLAGMVVNIIDRQNLIGEPYRLDTKDGLKTIAEDFAPLAMSDVVESFQQNGAMRGMLLTPLLLAGYGKSTFPLETYKIKVNSFRQGLKDIEDAETPSERMKLRTERPYLGNSKSAQIRSLITSVNKTENIIKDLEKQNNAPERLEAMQKRAETLKARVITLME